MEYIDKIRKILDEKEQERKELEYKALDALKEIVRLKETIQKRDERLNTHRGKINTSQEKVHDLNRQIDAKDQ